MAAAFGLALVAGLAHLAAHKSVTSRTVNVSSQGQTEIRSAIGGRLKKMREVKKERAILTDKEFSRFVACATVDRELRMLALVARCEGGMRGGRRQRAARDAPCRALRSASARAVRRARDPGRSTPSTTDRCARSRKAEYYQWAQQDSNLRLRPCEGRTLPLSYAPRSLRSV